MLANLYVTLITLCCNNNIKNANAVAWNTTTLVMKQILKIHHLHAGQEHRISRKQTRPRHLVISEWMPTACMEYSGPAGPMVLAATQQILEINCCKFPEQLKRSRLAWMKIHSGTLWWLWLTMMPPLYIFFDNVFLPKIHSVMIN